jgi:hypothetical protein
MFMAVYGCITWFLLCWIAGDFPSTQLMLGIVAVVAANDLKLRKQAPARANNPFTFPHEAAQNLKN